RVYRLSRFASDRLAATLPLLAQEPAEVKDDAKLFKPETIKKANEAVRDLDKQRIRLAIETYPTVPTDMIDKVKAMNAKEREEFFSEWSRKRVKELGANTILILLTSEPKHLHVWVGGEAAKRGFTPEDREALTKGMLEKLRKMQVDEALLDAVTTLRKRFDAPKP